MSQQVGAAIWMVFLCVLLFVTVVGVALLAWVSKQPPQRVSVMAQFKQTSTVQPIEINTDDTLIPSPTFTARFTITNPPAPAVRQNHPLTYTVTVPPTQAKPPTTTNNTVQPNSTTHPSRTYIVQAGDTLPEVAEKFGVSVLQVMQQNHIVNISEIYPGQVVEIPDTQLLDLNIPPGSGKRIVVDLSDQKLYAIHDNRLIFDFVVSTGQGDGTFTGSYKILDKLPKAYSDPWDFWMPNWMGIYYIGGTIENGIHGLPVLENGEQIWENTLGKPVSYGCVVLGPADAIKLYDWTEIGIPVEIRR